jgi:hypothetical protein
LKPPDEDEDEEDEENEEVDDEDEEDDEEDDEENEENEEEDEEEEDEEEDEEDDEEEDDEEDEEEEQTLRALLVYYFGQGDVQRLLASLVLADVKKLTLADVKKYLSSNTQSNTQYRGAFVMADDMSDFNDLSTLLLYCKEHGVHQLIITKYLYPLLEDVEEPRAKRQRQ